MNKNLNKLRSFLKKTLKAIIWVVTIFVLIFLIVASLIQIPSIQNKIVNFATTFVSNKTHTRVEINNVSISFPKSVVIEGLFLEDLNKDTLIYAGKAKINISLNDLLVNKIYISSFALEDVNLRLRRSTTDSLFNFNFLLEAFNDTTIQPKPKSETTVKWTFTVNNVYLQNIRLHFDDNYGGIKVATFLKNATLKMDEINLDKSIYSIDDLLVDGLIANVVMKESANKTDSKSSGLLPKITANNIQINNSALTYGDSVNKQSIKAAIQRFELKDGLVDLEDELVNLNHIYLTESNIIYLTVDTSLPVDTLIVIPTKNNWKVTVKSIEVNDNTLSYQVGNKLRIKTFDANRMNYKYVNLKASDLYYSSAKTEISVKEFSAIDQNNFAITKFATDFSMDEHTITAKNIKANTTKSSIDADVNLKFKSLNSLTDNLPGLILNLDMNKVSVNTSDILYFAPTLIEQEFFKNTKNNTIISGMVNGPVNKLTGKNMVLKTGNSTVLKTDFSIEGLPNAETAFFDFPNLKIKSVNQDIQMMVGSSIPKNIQLPDEINFLVVFKGRLKEFETSVGLNSSFGNAMLFGRVDKKENFSGSLNIFSFDVGSMLKDKEMYGPVSLSAEVVGHGLDPKTIKADIKATASKLYLNKYTYQNLKIDGTVNGQEFAGKVNLNDKNAMFDFDGLVNITPNLERYKFNLNVQGVNLQKLNFSKDDMRIGFNASADLKGGTINKLNGKAAVSNMIIAHNGKKYLLDSLMVASINLPNKSEMNINSALIGIKYKGTISPTELPATLSQFINHYFPLNDAKPIKNKSDSSNFNFEIQLHNHPILSEVLIPELKEFVPGLIVGSFDSRKNELKLDAKMKKIVYGSTEINDFAVSVNSDSTALDYRISSSAISNSQIKFDNFLFNGKIADNNLLASISSIDGLQNKKLLIKSQIIKENANYKLTLDPENFYLMNNRWDIAADNYIAFGKQGFLIHHLYINNAESKINIASVNDKFNDDLNIGIKNFKLENFSRIIEKDTNLIKGNVDGNVLLKRVNNSYGIIADVSVNNLVVREVAIGNLAVKADNPTSERFDIEMNLTGTDNNLTANGYFIPNGGDNSIKINADIKSLSMKTVEAFSMGQITEASGKVTGNFLIAGRTDAPDITGEMTFNNAFLKPSVLNNRVELKHETIQLKTDGIYFNAFTMRDADQNSAILEGEVKMKNFSDFIFALHINSKNFMLLNTTAKDNDAYYGRMIIDSKIDINGPFSLPVINAKVKMKKGSNFTFVVPEDQLTTDKGEDVIEFADTTKLNAILYGSTKKVVQKSGFTGFDLSSIIEVDKEATLRLLMDPTSSDSLVVRGDAALSFTMDRSGKMSLTGAYNLNEGSYLVSLESVIKRKFDIIPGSTIIWNGDPLDADISLNATYAVRAAPYDLVADQMSGMTDADKAAYKQLYPFLVMLKLRGAILQPVISFEIQLPPEEKGILGGAVNQKLNMLNDDPSSLNKQVFALLVLGRFVQENPLQTESGGTSTLVRSTVGNFLSTQLNKLSSKVVTGVELNFDIQSYDDYQTGQAQGRTQVEIGVKKQLFNERLTVQVGGSVDVEGEKAKQNSASNITGDVTAEYKLTKDGRYRLKGFRQNLYEGAIEGQLVESGAGVVYVRDFNKWKDFFEAPGKKKKTP